MFIQLVMPFNDDGRKQMQAAAKYHGMNIHADRIAEFCRRHGIIRLSFFGSILRDDFRPESDIDVLVEFEPGRTPGLAFFGMQEELSQILGRTVDLNTPGFLSDLFRDDVLREAEVQYVAR
jgi:uncharacterized protein